MPAAVRSRGFIVAALLPGFLVFAIFVVVPIFWSAYYGFLDWKGFGAARFVGLSNYREMLQDPVFWRALRNNLWLVASSIVGQIPVALLLAVALKRNGWFQRTIRSAIFLPMVLSTVVVGLIWGYIYHPQFGLLNAALEAVGLESWTRAWLSDPRVNMLAVSVSINWSNVGPYMVIFIAALQTISPEIEEAAAIDGAGRWAKLIAVTLPMLRNTILVSVVLCISGSLKAFDHVIVMTGGGPAQSTELLATYMYNNTFDIYRYGYGSAVSTAIIAVSAILIGLNRLLVGRKSD
ncbi:sugar ABC transporter permease [Paenibacillus sp. TRM 82003]|nr:sugar ABC transporter permease [Paenibacillus sp. TRM 82003]